MYRVKIEAFFCKNVFDHSDGDNFKIIIIIWSVFM